MKKRIDWHRIIQDLFDEALDAMSGYQIQEQGREERSYCFVCKVAEG